MIVLDTNVVSELMRPRPSSVVTSWVESRPDAEYFLTAMTAAELLQGVALMPAGTRRALIADRTARLLEEVFVGRVLAFDGAAAAEFAVFVARRRAAGRPVSTADAVVAATTSAAGAELATRNLRDFEGSGLVLHDPWGTEPGAR